MKKSLLFIAVLLAPLTVSADRVEIDGIFYTLIEKAKAAIVTKGGTYTGDIVIPEKVEYNGMTYAVTEIGSIAFGGSKDLLSVSIPNSVKNIGPYAFSNCSNMTAVTFNGGVTSIGSRAFLGCEKLSSVNICDLAAWCAIVFKYDDMKDAMDANPFYYAEHLLVNGEEMAQLVIPDGVSAISDYAFYSCFGITSVTFPSSLKAIGCQAFRYCSSLKKIDFGNGVTSIGDYAFQGSAVESLDIPGCIAEIGYCVFEKCTKLTAVNFANGLKDTGDCSFSGCYSLSSVSICNSMESIGTGTFAGCSSLKSITIPSSVKKVGGLAFANCPHLESVKISDLDAWCHINFLSGGSNPLSCGGHLYLNGELVTVVKLQGTVERIGNYAFYNYSDLTSVSIPSSVESIGTEAFYQCENLSDVRVGGSVTTIGDHAFTRCNSLTDISLPCVTTIGQQAFLDCSSLAAVKVGGGIRRIEWQAFARCENLTRFYCDATTVPYTGEAVFAKSYIEYADLYVPEACVEAYKTRSPWKEFRNIYGMKGGEGSATNVVYADHAAAGPVYDLQGRQIADDKLSQPGQRRGIVIQDGRKLVR